MNRFIKRCTGALAVSAVSIVLTAGIAGASAPPNGDGPTPGGWKPSPSAPSIDQSAHNDNHTGQDSKAKATSEQKNKNLPVAILAVGTNNGDVHQWNKAHNVAKSGNDNSTWQGIDQHAKQQVDGSKGHKPDPHQPDPYKPHPGDNGCGCSSEPPLLNGPTGDDNGGWKGDGHDSGPAIDQHAKNDNSTDQSSEAKATSEQKNINLPVAILAVGSNNGDVDQSNKAHNTALSGNDNSTWQGIDQHAKQQVDGSDGWHKPRPSDNGCGCSSEPPTLDGGGKGDGGGHDQGAGIDQHAKNDNSTWQTSEAKATSEQKNINLPVSILSVGSNNGDVDQSNKASNTALSGNDNSTWQGIDQHADQKVDGDGGGKPGKGDGGCGCSSEPKLDGGGQPGQGDGSGQAGIDQDASNDNSTTQESKADASSKQANVNVPVSILSVGSNNGDVDQSNSAHDTAVSGNSNSTGQDIDQGAWQKSDAGKGDAGAADVDQKADNSNWTDQQSKAKATSSQININAPISILSVGSNNGDVDQGNHASNGAGSFNDNGTGQWAGQSAGQSVNG